MASLRVACALWASAKAKALASETVQKFLEGKEPKKVVVVKGKLVNIVV